MKDEVCLAFLRIGIRIVSRRLILVKLFGACRSDMRDVGSGRLDRVPNDGGGCRGILQPNDSRIAWSRIFDLISKRVGRNQAESCERDCQEIEV